MLIPWIPGTRICAVAFENKLEAKTHAKKIIMKLTNLNGAPPLFFETSKFLDDEEFETSKFIDAEQLLYPSIAPENLASYVPFSKFSGTSHEYDNWPFLSVTSSSNRATPPDG
jgi:hypothetical protein